MTKIYSIYDIKSESFAMPFYAVNDAVAIRTVQDAMAQPEIPLARYPNDFAIYYLGEFEEETGLINPAEMPCHIIILAQIRQESLPGFNPEKPSMNNFLEDKEDLENDSREVEQIVLDEQTYPVRGQQS